MTDAEIRTALTAVLAAAADAVTAAANYATKAELAAAGAETSAEAALARIEEAQALVAQLGEVEPPPLPDRIGEWTNITSPVDLGVGGLLGCRLITAAVEFNGPPGAKHEKLVGADSTANDFGGMCMERTTKGLYSVWVQAEGSKVVQLPIQPKVPTFVTFELPLATVGATLDEQHGSTPLPRAPDPFDGKAALLAGYWKHNKVDPANAVIYKMRAYRSWSQERIDADRADYADLLEPDIEPPPPNGGGNGGPPDPEPPSDLEQIDPRATQVRMDVQAGPEQEWRGFGHTASSPTAALKSPELIAKWPQRLFEDIGTRWTAFYGAHQNYQALFKLAYTHGVRGVFIHGFLYRQGITPAQFAAQIAALTWIPYDVEVVVCCQNEPDGNTGNRWPGYPNVKATWTGAMAAARPAEAARALKPEAAADHDHDLFEPVPIPEDKRLRALALAADAQTRSVVSDTIALRRELDARSLQRVKIATNPYAHFGDMCDAEFDALVAAGFLPEGLGGHCYSDCPTPENFRRARENWCCAVSTETGYGGPENSPARFLSAINNGAGVHLHFEGQAVDTGAEAMKNCLVTTDGATRPWYNPYRVLNTRLPVGSFVRGVSSDNRPGGMPADYAQWMVRHRSGSGLVYPKFHCAAAKRPDGRWWLGACNATFGSTASTGNLGTHWGAERGQLTVRVAELAGKDGTWTGQRSTSGGGSIKPPETVRMKDGFLRFTLEPGETLALVGSV